MRRYQQWRRESYQNLRERTLLSSDKIVKNTDASKLLILRQKNTTSYPSLCQWKKTQCTLNSFTLTAFEEKKGSLLVQSCSHLAMYLYSLLPFPFPFPVWTVSSSLFTLTHFSFSCPLLPSQLLRRRLAITKATVSTRKKEKERERKKERGREREGEK